MKVLFIYPNAGSQLGFNYGVAHLSAVLKSAGHEVALLQLCEEMSPLPSRRAFVKAVQKENPHLVGFSVVTNQWAYTMKLAAWTREATQAPLVCGGIHAMAAPAEILESGLFDYILRGEAEEALLELVQKLEQGEDTTRVKNLGFVHDGKIHINPVRTLPDLNRLPFKDYEIFDFQKIIDAKKGWVGLMASRGCPFACTYCFNHHMVKSYRHDLRCSFQALNYIRHFAIDDIIAEIDYLFRHYRRIKMFIFDDDLFTYYRDYVKAFCSAYRKVSELPFVVNAHVGFFDADRAGYLAAANCKIVKFGVESGSPRIRKQIKWEPPHSQTDHESPYEQCGHYRCHSNRQGSGTAYLRFFNDRSAGRNRRRYNGHHQINGRLPAGSLSLVLAGPFSSRFPAPKPMSSATKKT
jgi:radical SAM superfamily enzyme YgiQ (UPF0313 family)